jgi:hypothetical protein
MVLSLKHVFQSEKADGSDATIIRPSNWNEEHALTTAADTLLGRASGGAGPAQEIICTSFARSILDDLDAIIARTTLGAAKAATISTSAPSGGADGDVWYVVADTTPPTIFTSSTASVSENAQLAVALAADESVTWTLTGGADQSRFEISGTTLRWTGNTTRDFESPVDANADNVYVVQVTATDPSNNAANKTISVTVTDVSEGADTTKPVITSRDIYSVVTLTPLAITLTANEPVTWSLNSGNDTSQFEISGNTLRWLGNGVKNFNTPTDGGLNNSYICFLRATDTAGNFTDQLMTVYVIATVDVTAPIISTNAAQTVAENAFLFVSLVANEPAVWSITGGADAVKFVISGELLAWAGTGKKDFEAPDDANLDNVYEVQVTATDGAGNTTSKLISVTVTDVAEGGDTTPPTISTSATASIAENSTLAIALTADETVTWAITGGADASRFEISGTTLRWVGNGVKDFEAPNDADANNVYVVQITATDAASNATNKTISVTVTDVSDTGAWTPLSLGSKLAAYCDTKLSTITGTTHVSQITDLSGNGYHFTDVGGGPAYNATGFSSGKPSLDFDGASSILQANGVSLGGTSFWCAIIATLDTSGGGDCTATGISDSAQSGQLLCFYESGTSTSIYTFRRSGLDSGPLSVTANTRFRAYTRFNGTDNVLKINSLAAGAVANTAAFDATVTLGIGNLPDRSLSSWKGKIGVVLFGKGVLTPTEEADLDAWLTAW